MAHAPHRSMPIFPPTRLRRAAVLAATSAVLATVSGCVVAPVGPGYYDPGPGSVQVVPAYPSPGYGWIWLQHPRHGWGWRHPHRGWHRGWR